jgi:hypothetical protein
MGLEIIAHIGRDTATTNTKLPSDLVVNVFERF